MFIDESKFRTWSKSVEMAMDEIWVGLEDGLRLVKTRLEPMSPEEFGTKLDECRLRPPDCPHMDVWFHQSVHVQRAVRIVEQCETSKDGIEAYRLVSIHCDPTNFNTSNTLMESTKRAFVRFSVFFILAAN